MFIDPNTTTNHSVRMSVATSPKLTRRNRALEQLEKDRRAALEEQARLQAELSAAIRAFASTAN